MKFAVACIDASTDYILDRVERMGNNSAVSDTHSVDLLGIFKAESLVEHHWAYVPVYVYFGRPCAIVVWLYMDQFTCYSWYHWGQI